jgi:tuftelin-interacting protein 11
MVVSLNYEENCHRERLIAQKAQIEKIQDILAIIEICESQLSDSTKETSIQDLISTFVNLKREYTDEFIIFNLSQLAIPLFTPMLKKKMSRWNPFLEDLMSSSRAENEILFCYDIFAELQDLFKDSSSYQSGNNSINPYHRLVWDTWMFSFRKLLYQENLKTCGNRCVEILSSWSKLIPKYINENILEQIVLAKLNYEVDAWNPLVDVIPIHK